jgi:hypothetical protein
MRLAEMEEDWGNRLIRTGAKPLFNKKVNVYLSITVYAQLRKSAVFQNLKPGAKPLKI